MLVVDRDENARDALRKEMQDAFDVRSAADGDEAAKRFAFDTFDAAIVECRSAGPGDVTLPVALSEHLSPGRLIVRVPEDDTSISDFRWTYIHRNDEYWFLKELLAEILKVKRVRVTTDRNRAAFRAQFDRRFRMLVVDDEEEQCVHFRDLFSSALDVVTATSVAAALKQFDLDTVDLAIIDWHLPAESGMTLARELRQYLSDEYIMLYTADDVAQSHQTGAFRYVPKSIEFEELERRIFSLLEKRTPARVALARELDWKGRSLGPEDVRAEFGTARPGMLIVCPDQAIRSKYTELFGKGFHTYQATQTGAIPSGRSADMFDFVLMIDNQERGNIAQEAAAFGDYLPSNRVFILTQNENNYLTANAPFTAINLSTSPEQLLRIVEIAMDNPQRVTATLTNQSEENESLECAGAGELCSLCVMADSSKQKEVQDMLAPEYKTWVAHGVAKAARTYDLASVSLAIIQRNIGKESGLPLARYLRRHLPQERIIVFSDEPSVKDCAGSIFTAVVSTDGPAALRQAVEKARAFSLNTKSS